MLRHYIGAAFGIDEDTFDQAVGDQELYDQRVIMGPLHPFQVFRTKVYLKGGLAPLHSVDVLYLPELACFLVLGS